MNEQTNSKPTIFFWIISVVALVWNGMGVYAYLNNVFMSEEAFAQMTEAQQNLMENTPSWVIGAFAIAVFTGFFGSIGLLVRRRWATPLFGLSLIAIIIQQIYNQMIAKMHTVMGGNTIIFSVILILISVVLFLLARNWVRRGWLR